MKTGQFMHPRNKYKDKPIDFAFLASKYSDFRETATVDLGGKVHIDLKDPVAPAALTKSVLKEDFNLDVPAGQANTSRTAAAELHTLAGGPSPGQGVVRARRGHRVRRFVRVPTAGRTSLRMDVPSH